MNSLQCGTLLVQALLSDGFGELRKYSSNGTKQNDETHLTRLFEIV